MSETERRWLSNRMLANLKRDAIDDVEPLADETMTRIKRGLHAMPKDETMTTTEGQSQG